MQIAKSKVPGFPAYLMVFNQLFAALPLTSNPLAYILFFIMIKYLLNIHGFSTTNNFWH